MSDKLRPFGQSLKTGFVGSYEGLEYDHRKNPNGCIHNKVYSHNGNQWVCSECAAEGFGLTEREKPETK
jgi:hypothetical protein